MEYERIHPSHDLRENGSERFPEDSGGIFAGQLIEYAIEPHTSGWYCARCKAYTCMLCREGDSLGDEELTGPCAPEPD